MAGPAEVGKEAFAFDRLKDFLNPSGETTEVLRRLVEVDLLESGRFRFHQDVVANQGLGARGSEAQLILRVHVNHPVQLVLALRLRVAFRRSLQLGDDQVARTPAADRTRKVIEAMRDRRVLLGVTGPAGNVLKIRPPLVFQREHADRLLDLMDGVFASSAP